MVPGMNEPQIAEELDRHVSELLKDQVFREVQVKFEVKLYLPDDPKHPLQHAVADVLEQHVKILRNDPKAPAKGEAPGIKWSVTIFDVEG